MKKFIILMSIALLGLTSCNNQDSGKINLRLKWAYQAQFSGYLVAKEKGFYKEVGLDVNIQPAGPDLKPYSTVATGSDDIGIGIINQIIPARSNDVPLVVISQIFQDSPIRFALKRKNKIDSLQQLRNKKVGLWLGGDEVEFIAMLKDAGMTIQDVKVIPEKFNIAPFLQDEYVCSEVTVYNELNQIKSQGYTGDSLQIISPKDYNCALLGDLIFTNEKYLNGHPEQIRKFLAASFKGWKYAFSHPDETVDIILKFNPELKKEEQKKQLGTIQSIVNTGGTPAHGLGYMNIAEYQNAKRILLTALDPKSDEYKKLEKVDIKTVFNTNIWDKLGQSEKMLK